MTIKISNAYWQGEEVDYRGALHRDGSVLMSVSLDQLKVLLLINVFLFSLIIFFQVISAFSLF